MKKYVEGSFTIEASFLMPILILLFVFLLHLTIRLSVSYTHLRAHETGRNLVCRLLLEKKKKKIKKKKKKKFFFFFFFNDTATTEIYTLHIVGSVRCV